MTFRCSTIALTGFALIACGSPTGSSDKPYAEFFPLAVGNRWEYEQYNRIDNTWIDRSVWEVTDAIQSNGLEYFEITRSRDRGSPYKYYYRFSSDTLLAYSDLKSVTADSGVVVAVFSLGVDEGFRYDSTSNEYVARVMLKTDDEITILYDYPRSADDRHSTTFQRGIGITRMYSNDWGVGEELVTYDLAESNDPQ